MAKNSYNGFTYEQRCLSSYIFRRGIKLGWWDAPQKDECDACHISAHDNTRVEWHRENYRTVHPRSIISLCYRCHRVLHLRREYPSAWIRYRHMVAAGFQFSGTTSIGTVISDLEKGGVGFAMNEPRESTCLDLLQIDYALADIQAWNHETDTKDTNEEVFARMQEVKDLIKGKRQCDFSTGIQALLYL